MSDEVRSLLDERFDCTAMPPTRVKGKAAPIQTWCVDSRLRNVP